MGGTCGICGGGEMHTGFWCGNLKEIDHLEDLVIDWKLVLIKWTLKSRIGGGFI